MHKISSHNVLYHEYGMYYLCDAFSNFFFNFGFILSRLPSERRKHISSKTFT